jgi:hypothetical protein
MTTYILCDKNLKIIDKRLAKYALKLESNVFCFVSKQTNNEIKYRCVNAFLQLKDFYFNPSLLSERRKSMNQSQMLRCGKPRRG